MHNDTFRPLIPQRPVAGSDNDSAVGLAYARLAACRDDAERTRATAELILAVFDEFYRVLCEYPYRAKVAFETSDPHASIRISRERLALYSRYISEHGPRLRAAFPALAENPKVWDALDPMFVAMNVDRYEADIASSFAHSLRRNIGREIWRPVAYSFPPPSKRRVYSMASVHRRLFVKDRIDCELIASALRVPGFGTPFRDLEGDSRAIVERLERVLYEAPDA